MSETTTYVNRYQVVDEGLQKLKGLSYLIVNWEPYMTKKGKLYEFKCLVTNPQGRQVLALFPFFDSSILSGAVPEILERGHLCLLGVFERPTLVPFTSYLVGEDNSQLEMWAPGRCWQCHPEGEKLDAATP